MQHGYSSPRKYRRLITNSLTASLMFKLINDLIVRNHEKAEKLISIAKKHKLNGNIGAAKLYTKRVDRLLKYRNHELLTWQDDVCHLLEKFVEEGK